MNSGSSVKYFSASTWLDTLPLLGGRLGLVLGDHPQIVGDHAPADPAFHPNIPMVVAAVKPMPPLELADPPFNARAPVTPAPEPALAFMGHPRRWLPTRSGQDDLPYPTLLGGRFIRRRRQFAIA